MRGSRPKAPKPYRIVLEQPRRPRISFGPRLRDEIKNPAVAVDDPSTEPGCNSWNGRAVFDVH